MSDANELGRFPLEGGSDVLWAILLAGAVVVVILVIKRREKRD